MNATAGIFAGTDPAAADVVVDRPAKVAGDVDNHPLATATVDFADDAPGFAGSVEERGGGQRTGAAPSDADPGLDPAGTGDHGGPTPTIALTVTSAAHVDAPPACPTEMTTDQRGALRPAGGRCDSGSFQLAVPTAHEPELVEVTEHTAELAVSVDTPFLEDGELVVRYGTVPGALDQATPPQPIGALTRDTPRPVFLAGLDAGPRTTSRPR